MEAMWMRFIPAVQRAITKARSGDIGEVHTIFADFGIPLKCTEQDHRFEKVAGGAWLDRGVYGLSLAIQLFGQPISIAANATTWRTGCDLQSSAILRFHGNRLAIITASLSGYSSNEAVLAGSKGRIRLHETFVRPDAISLKTAPVLSVSNHDKPGRLRERVKESALMRRLLRGIRREKQETTAFAGNGFCHEVTEVVRCLQAGLPESPVMPLQDTIAVMHASDQVRAKWLEEESIE
jgi:predicted dehydrogenase